MRHRTVICVLFVAGIPLVAMLLVVGCGRQNVPHPTTGDLEQEASLAPVAEQKPVDTVTSTQFPTAIPAALPALGESTSPEATPVVAEEPEPQQQNEDPAPPEPVPTKIPTEQTMTSGSSGHVVRASTYGYSRGPTTLEERIFKADVIARARLRSVSPAVRLFDSPIESSTRYATFVELTFDILESLKGNAGNTAIVELQAVGVIDFEVTAPPYGTYATSQEAVQISQNWIDSERDSQWDNRDAIIFLWTSANSKTYHVTGRPPTVQYVFVGELSTDGLVFNGRDQYSISSEDNKVWLPATVATSLEASRTSDETQLFFLDAPTTETPTPPTISLADLKSRITTVSAMAAPTIEGHRECLLLKFTEERSGVPKFPEFRIEIDEHTSSGQAAGSVLKQLRGTPKSAGYDGYVVDGGPDSNLFEAATIDDDNDSSNGYTAAIKMLRPIPKGQYVYHQTYREAELIPCNYVPRNRAHVTVHVTAPESTLHELFFDPVTVGNTVVADSTNGVLKPAAFTASNGASATIGSISYVPPSSMSSVQVGTVKLTLSPHTGLANHIVDFIELDGTVSLSLDVAAATVDAANDTLSWSVESQPWHDGDKLMVRIREAP